MKFKKPSFSTLLTPILIIGILMFAGLVTFVSISAYQSEQERIESYTHSRMKSLILDLETKLCSIESALLAESHSHLVLLEDSDKIYTRLEKMVDDQGFINHVGLDIWYEDRPDTCSWTLYVSRHPNGTITHECIWTLDADYMGMLSDCFDKAYETGDPVWTQPYYDSIFINEYVVTCFIRAENHWAMLNTDVEMDRLLATIDSLQFYADSKMYIDVPDGPIYTLENGELVNVNSIDYDEKRFTRISARYRHLNFDIINIVPNEMVFDSIWKRIFIIFLVFAVALTILAILVHRSFNKAQMNLASSMKKAADEELVLKRIENDIAVAARIQNRMLTNPGCPVHLIASDRMAVDIMSEIIPAREVGGDLYEYRVDGDYLSVCIGDVSGKGIPASMIMSKCCTLFHAYVSHKSNVDPSHLLSFMNTQLCRNNEDMMFVTMWVGVLDLQTGQLKYSSAGHNPPVLVRNSSALFMEKCQGLPLGVFQGNEYPLNECSMKKGDTLLLYTDGITEAEGPGNVLFGDDRLLEVCSSASSGCPEILCQTVLNSVNAHVAGCNQSDDITILCFTFGEHIAQLQSIYDVKAIHTLVSECNESDEAALVLEEAAVNALTHGHAKNVCIQYNEGVFTMISDGDDFNPTTYRVPDLADGEIRVNGRGIPLIRQLCSNITYNRTENGFNIQTFRL